MGINRKNYQGATGISLAGNKRQGYFNIFLEMGFPYQKA